MAEHYWYCEHCGEDVLAGSNHPSVSGCKKAQMHKWYDLGKKGDLTIWTCKHCETEVMMDGKPNAQGCSVETLHAWVGKSVGKSKNQKETASIQAGGEEKKSFWTPIWAIPFKLIWGIFKGLWWVLKKFVGK
jgi:hypothetical protein